MALFFTLPYEIMVEVPTLLSFFRKIKCHIYISISQQNYKKNYKKNSDLVFSIVGYKTLTQYLPIG